jgi:hypothetical protein
LRFFGVFKVSVTTPSSSSRLKRSAVATDGAGDVGIGVSTG